MRENIRRSIIYFLRDVYTQLDAQIQPESMQEIPIVTNIVRDFDWGLQLPLNPELAYAHLIYSGFRKCILKYITLLRREFFSQF